MMRSAWDSSELPPDNAFTRSILLRTLALLVRHQSVPLASVIGMPKQELSPQERAEKALRTLREDPELSELSTAADAASSKISNVRKKLTVQGLVELMAKSLP